MRAYFQMGTGRRDDEAQGLVEYALILALIAIICLLAVASVGTNVNGLIQAVASSLTTVS
jgi:pilus assembly protein Flp/PilA